MSNKTLTVLIPNDPPAVFSNCRQFPTFQPSLYCIFPGWVVEITKMLADFIGAEIISVIASPEIVSQGFGLKVNGTWKGFLGPVYERRVDTVTEFFQFTELRAADFAYSYPVYNLKIAAYVRAKDRKLEDYIWSSFEPFTASLWILLLVTVLVQACYATVIQRLEFQLKLVKRFSKFEHLWLYSRLLLLQGEDCIPFVTQSGHFAFIIYAILLVTLFTNLYQGSLLSALLQNTGQAPFKDWDEMMNLVGKGQYQIVADKIQYTTVWYYSNFLTGNGSVSLQFQKAIKNNPILLKDSLEEAIDAVTHGRYIFISQEDESSVIEIEKHCGILKVTKGFMEKAGHFLFLPGNPIIEEINHAILMNDDFIRRTYQKYFLNGYQFEAYPKCPNSQDYISEAQRPLDIVSTFGIFLIFIICIILCIITFALELCHYFYTQGQPKKMSKVNIKLDQFHLKSS